MIEPKSHEIARIKPDMLRLLPSPIKIVINFLWAALSTGTIAILIIVLGIFKLIPIRPWQRFVSVIANGLFRAWGYAMAFLFKLTQTSDWRIENSTQLKRDSWYMIMSNHLSWVDIIVLVTLAHKDLPMPRFFLKQELFWIPLVGVGCWVLDMPFMKRYSRQTLEKKPHLKGKDIETTKRSCAKFRHIPTTVINFCEGTRFTEKKRVAKSSPYRHLLPPKAGGTAFTLQAMQGTFDTILDITIVYPERNPDKPLVIDFLAGRLKTVHLHIDPIPVTNELIGDYFNDPEFQASFQDWLNKRWTLKDQRIEQIINQQEQPRP